MLRRSMCVLLLPVPSTVPAVAQKQAVEAVPDALHEASMSDASIPIPNELASSVEAMTHGAG